MNLPLPSYLSLRYESEVEKEYISGLVYQFEMARDIGSYHLALFAYHLLFMVFIYQTILKCRIWKINEFSLALTFFSADKRKEYAETNSVYTFSEIPERSIFEFLNLFQSCEETVSKCKKNIIDYRNNNLGHANLFLVSEEEFNKKTEEYDQISGEIHDLTQKELSKIFSEYISSIEPDEETTKDDLELNLIIPNRLSDQDLEKLAIECKIKPTLQKEKISKIIQDDFGVYVEIV